MDLRFYIALFIGKLTALIVKVNGSGATAAPGLYALNFDPDFVKKFSRKIKNGSIIVTGTNGKTTTSRLIYDTISTKYKVLHNRQGSNLLRGIASAFITNSSLTGKADYDIALWEIDEAVLPTAIKDTSPKTIIFLNIFRDQLDRYGEVDTIKKSWQKALVKLNHKTLIIINSDDPGINHLKSYFKGKTVTFGIEDEEINLPPISNVSDIKNCPKCDSELIYTARLSSHLGKFNCSNCSFSRSQPNISASKIQFKKGFNTSFTLKAAKSSLSLNVKMPGLYSVYNILAAASLAFSEDIKLNIFAKLVTKYSAAFGRFQILTIGDKKIIIFLIKNPAGANEVLRTLSLEDNINLLTILNDNTADGKDVSWIWDTKWEILTSKIKRLSVSGVRSWDLANRLKYAGITMSNNVIYKNINYSIANTIADMSINDTLYLLPTYTSLLKVHKVLNKLGGIEKWHKN